MCPKTLVVRLLVLISIAMGVVAQTDQASCKPGWEWNQNTLGQDPCTVASMLDAACHHNYSYYYPNINTSESYPSPSANYSRDLTCDCDTVIYSLVMACSTCQDGTAYAWDKWEAACDGVFISQYSSTIPMGTAIPGWAFYDVTLLSNQTFDNAFAQALGRDPEAFPPPTKSSSLSDPTATVNTTKKPSSKTGAIAGGVVGGVAGLVFALMFAYFLYRFRQNKNERAGHARWNYVKIGEHDAQQKTPPHSLPPTAAPLYPPRPDTPPKPPLNQFVTYVTPIISGSR